MRRKIFAVAILFCGGCSFPSIPDGKPVPPPVGKIAVLIVEDVDQRDDLPQEQRDILASPRIRQYIRDHGRAGGQDAFRVYWDRMEGEPPAFWREGFARPRSRLPWLIVTNGKAGAEGPLPSTEDDVLAVLRRFGG